MIVSGILHQVKSVKIPKDSGGEREIYQLFMDEDTVQPHNFHAVFVTALDEHFTAAYSKSREMYVSVKIESIVQKTTRQGRHFTNFFGTISDWKVIS